MVKINRVVLRVAVVVAAIIGLLNLANGIYAGAAVDAATSGLTMAATIEPSMTLTLSDSSKILNIIPTSSGSFNSTSITVGAYSNGRIGYTLTMTPEHTALTGSGINTIPTLSTDSTCTGGSTCSSSNFAAGYWGIAVGDNVYGPAATTNLVTVSDATATVANNTYTIYLGANLDLSIPTDNYSTTLNFALTSSTVAAYDVTFNYDSNISSLAVQDLSGNTLTPITSSTGTATYSLDYANTYTLTPTYASGYEFNTISLTGAGYLMEDSLTFVAGAGVSTVSVASKMTPQPLYNLVAAMSKGKNTDASSNFSWTSITTPTTTNPATDTSTSGVFEWDGLTAGNGVDSNGGDSKIYFYRGILDTTTTYYGSDGLADAYPNYVRLGDTCWRIVRTTSTGGVKMIYNGSYSGGTTANSCANAQTNAQLTTSPFNTDSATVAGTAYTGLQYQNIHAVGYTYTSSVAADTTATKTPAQLFGASGNDTTTNNQSSIIKQYIEDWYAANMTSYTSILEGDAGYCQDRRLNTSTTWTTPLAENSNTIVPYGTSGLTTYYFGAYPRNTQSSTFNPLLTCPRGKVDLYSYSGDAGNGNGQLTHPVALLTADEASLAGNGRDNSFSAYNANSFLRSGSRFWLLSPYYRNSGGHANGFILYSGGDLSTGIVDGTLGVRPAISLRSGTTVSSGSGIATDPWVVTAP